MIRIGVCILLLMVMPLLAGFTFLVELRPVAGPLKDEGETVPLKAFFDITKSGRGKAVLNLSGQERCEGEYILFEKDQEYTPYFNWSDYQKYYGAKFTPLKQLQYGQAVLYGDKGTIVEAEFYVNFWRRYGLAKDNNHNVYKL